MRRSAEVAKKSWRKRRARSEPRLDHFCPQCGQFQAFQLGVVVPLFNTITGSVFPLTRMLTGFVAGSYTIWEVIMSNNGKSKHGFWLTPEAKEKVEKFYRIDNCKSQSEFLEKAINFYVGYVCTENASAYLPRILSEVLEGKFAVIKKKLGRMMFKHSVETNITNHILAADTDMDQQTYEHLRNRSVREVLETNGEITFLDDLKFQKSV